MAIARLTDLSIKRLRSPKSGQRSYFDSTLKGFGVRCSQGGSKSFIAVIGATRKLTTIGRVGIVSLAEARQEAKRLMAEHTLGRHQFRSIPFGEAKTRYLTECETRNKPRTVKDYQRILNSHFKFGKTQLEDITQDDILKRINRLSDTPREQAHAFTVIRGFLRWCVRHRYLERNPIASLIPPKTSPPRDRVLTDEELKEVYQKSLQFDHPFGPIVSLLILTGMRRGETAALKWDWIDENERTITLPPEVTKNGRTHTFPYGPGVAGVFTQIPQPSDYLFPASRRMSEATTVFNGWGKPKKAFDETLVHVNPYRLHDLRRTFSTKLARLGTPLHVTEKLLNHATGSVSGVVGVYNRYSYMDEMRVAIEAYEKVLK